jgi:hypothetical protein
MKTNVPQSCRLIGPGSVTVNIQIPLRGAPESRVLTDMVKGQDSKAPVRVLVEASFVARGNLYSIANDGIVRNADSLGQPGCSCASHSSAMHLSIQEEGTRKPLEKLRNASFFLPSPGPSFLDARTGVPRSFGIRSSMTGNSAERGCEWLRSCVIRKIRDSGRSAVRAASRASPKEAGWTTSPLRG